jgi:hypothetical protein
MQPMRYLKEWLEQNADNQHYLFSFRNLRALYPDLSDISFKTLLSRAVHAGYLTRVCRGIYLYKKSFIPDGLLLFHIAAILRADEFNYVSLESVLSEAGVISQVPINRISIMSSGRSNVISCGQIGTIEFIHTTKKSNELIDDLSYDKNYGLWRASVPLALKDMKKTHRQCDLIDWGSTDEFI